MDTTFSLRVERVIAAPAEALFDAWTTPAMLQQWLHPADDWTTPVADTDARVGGSYRWGICAPDGTTFYEVGEFLEIARPLRLAYTCRFEDGGAFRMPKEEHIVRVTFEPVDVGTRVVVVQEGYRDAAQRDEQQQGWPAFLSQLERFATHTAMHVPPL